jgi:putative ABC transport system permease protein
MHFIALIFKNLLRRPARSLLTIVGLGVSVGAMVSLVGLASGFERSFLEHYSQRGVDLIVQRASQGTETLNNGLPEKLGTELAKVPGVRQVLTRLFDQVSFERDGIIGVIIGGWPIGSPLFDRLTILNGRQLAVGDKRKAMVGRVLAAHLGKMVGDEIELYNEPFEIVGIFESPTMFENGGVVVPLEELQRLMHRPGEVSGYTISAERPMSEAGTEELRQRIERLAPRLAVSATADFVENFNQIRVGRAVAWSISAVALVIGAIGMLNTMFMSVFERTKEIGLLRAIGWRRGRIVRMVVGESLLLSLAGGVGGIVLGVPSAKLLSMMPNIAEISEGVVSVPAMLEGLTVAILIGAAGAIYPALWSAGLLPTEALRR